MNAGKMQVRTRGKEGEAMRITDAGITPRQTATPAQEVRHG